MAFEHIVIPNSTATINVTYNGFTPQAQTAFQRAVDIWQTLIVSPIVINVTATWQPNSDPNNLGSASAAKFETNFTNAPLTNIQYPAALANSLAGQDLDTAQVDINTNFNSNRTDWYLGVDGNVPIGQFDLVSVVLHELGHALGFDNSFNFDDRPALPTSGQGSRDNNPKIFDQFTENGANQNLTDATLFPNNSTQLGNELISNNLFLDSPTTGTVNNGNPVRLFAPNPWRGGSSTVHLDEGTYNNTIDALMTPSFGPREVTRQPGAITFRLFQDMGWRMNVDGWMYGTSTNDTLTGTNIGQNLFGLEGVDSLFGRGGDDALYGCAGSDFLSGEDGNDILFGGSGNDEQDGGIGNDEMSGEDGNDTLTGGVGADTLIGGEGLDTAFYTNSSGGVSVNLATGEGSSGDAQGDTLQTIENLEGSQRSDTLIGNTANNQLSGQAGDDTLTGGVGADTLIGGEGLDTAFYTNSSGGVSVNLATGEGSSGDAQGDTLQTIENLEGSQRSDTLIGNTANNQLSGQAGSDTLSGESGRDTLYGGDGDDNLSGKVGDDNLSGEDGNDTLDGGLGDDSMIGGTGNDVYLIESITDKVTESVNQGIDTVKSSITYTLGENLENLTLTENKSINGIGNNLENIILGNDANNSLFGGAGKDTLLGGDGNDIMDGGVKSDIMAGGLGNDSYIVDSTADQIIEDENEGTDTAYASVSYVISNNIENLNLTGGDTINGTGNSIDNIINGNDAVNYVHAGDGADRINGASGDDYIFGESGNDSIIGGKGNDNLNGGLGDDVVSGNKGQDWLVGGLGNDSLIGGAGKDHLVGGTGDDVLVGGADKDWLTGGTGADQFAFRSPKDKTDIITDFRISDGDRISVSAKRFGKTLKVGALSADQFTLGDKAQGASDRFIYNSSTGGLFFDSDGIGSAKQVQIASLGKGLSLTNHDITVVV